VEWVVHLDDLNVMGCSHPQYAQTEHCPFKKGVRTAVPASDRCRTLQKGFSKAVIDSERPLEKFQAFIFFTESS
jgi:hypothetical protein